MSVTVLAGGVGAARFLRGLVRAVPPTDVTAVVNTGDDTELHGLAISPDLDTVTYTLADAIDPERGWGLGGESWAAMAALERYASVRPDGSSALAQGSSSKVVASGRASTSASWTRLKPSMAVPSNWTPSSNTVSSSAGEMATDLSCPRTSVNHNRMRRTPRSSKASWMWRRRPASKT